MLTITTGKVRACPFLFLLCWFNGLGSICVYTLFVLLWHDLPNGYDWRTTVSSDFFFLFSLCLSARSTIGTQRWLIYLSISSSSAGTCKDIQPLFLYNRSAVRFIFKLCTLELGKIKMSRATKKETQIDNNADGHSGNASQSVSMSHFYKLDLQ